MRARDNPFRSQRLRALSYQLDGSTWADLLRRFEELGRRAALVGPRGHGKSTLLGALCARLERRGLSPLRVTLRLEDRHPGERLAPLLARLDASSLLVVDSFDLLSRRARRRTLRAAQGAAGALVTRHTAGDLPTLFVCRTSPDLLRRLVESLRGPRPAAGEPPPGALFERHGGNLRRALGELYDHYGLLEDPW